MSPASLNNFSDIPDYEIKQIKREEKLNSYRRSVLDLITSKTHEIDIIKKNNPSGIKKFIEMLTIITNKDKTLVDDKIIQDILEIFEEQPKNVNTLIAKFG